MTERLNPAVSANDPNETKGVPLGFILGIIVVIGVIGAVLIKLRF